MRISEFRNTKTEDRFRAAYERALAQLWPGHRTTLDLPTAFGTTRVYRTGPDRGRPLVLLPGSGGNALMWHRYVAPLAEHHPVIAVDTVGEPGASIQTAPVRDGRDGAAWLDELLTALGLSDPHLVGCSYGGWLALQHRLHHPGRTAGLTLVDPAGLADPGRRFYTWLIAGGLAATAPRPLRPRLARLVDNSTILETELMTLVRASLGFRRALPPATTLDDRELARLAGLPTLVLLGERSALHDAHRAAARLAPHARVEIVPGAGHALPTDAPGLVVSRILTSAAGQAA
ncbi:alpha/beta fold hydrolase [Kitasatospora sp. NPDC048538]|uniref:alpha/beta fold hydrolase n=1 Tax=unclassified Kitasatospora TaxID=2633591 RepID=UPI0033DA1D5D